VQDRPRRSLRLLNELRCTPMEVDEAVDHGGGGDVVAEDLSPAPNGLLLVTIKLALSYLADTS